MTNQEQLAEIIHHIELRKKINPLEFFKPLKLQAAFKACLAKIKGVFGGNRSGKTAIGADYIIEKCLSKPRQRWWAVAETEEVSVNIQQRKIWELLPKLEMRYCYYDEINGFRNGKVVFKNGSMIRFKTYKQGREAFASDDIDGIWNDEEPPIEIYKEQRMRLIDRDGEMIFTMTSLNGITDLMADIFEDHEVKESELSPLVNESLPRIVEKGGMTFFILWTTENPHINQARLVEEVKLMTPQEIKSRILGIPTNLSGKIYPSYNKRVHVVTWDMLPKRKVTIYHVLDPHDRKPWAMGWYAVTQTNTVYTIYEYPFGRNFNEMDYDDKTYDDYAKVIEDIESDIIIPNFGRSVSIRIIDPNFGNKTVRIAERVDYRADTTAVKELSKRGLKFKDGIDALETGHLQVRKYLHWAEKDGEIVVQPQFFDWEECQNHIRHTSRYSRKDLMTADGDVKDSAAPMDKYKDYCDLKRYLCMANPHFIERKSQAYEPVEKVY